MALARRATRLEPLTEKYGRHAPYWQFVVWGRTLALIVLETAITPQIVAPPAHAYVQMAAAAVIIVISLILQLVYQPFEEEVLPGISQNRLEAALLANNIIQLITVAIYNDMRQRGGGGGGRTVVDAILCALFLAPPIVVAGLLLRSRRLRRVLTGRSSRLSSVRASFSSGPASFLKDLGRRSQGKAATALSPDRDLISPMEA